MKYKSLIDAEPYKKVGNKTEFDAKTREDLLKQAQNILEQFCGKTPKEKKTSSLPVFGLSNKNATFLSNDEFKKLKEEQG